MANVNLESRTSILETRMDYVEEQLNSQVAKFDELCTTVVQVREHIAKQNGALPRIEEYVKQCSIRLNAVEQIEKEEAISDAKEHTSLNLRQKIIWGILLFIAGAGGTQIIDLIFRHLGG